MCHGKHDLWVQILPSPLQISISKEEIILTIQENVFIDYPTVQHTEIQNKIINLLHENNYSISQARGLFKSTIEMLERFMPITNETI